jgi:hypothetical protein
MSATQQNLVNAMVQEQLKFLEHHLNSYKQEQNERLEKLESIVSASTSNNRNGNPTSPMAFRSKPARRMSTAMENTIRLSSQEQLANLVVQLCNHDDDTQNLATSLLLDGEGDTDMSGPPSPHAMTGASSKRRAPDDASPVRTCKNCGIEYVLHAGPRSGDECWFHPGR